MQPADESPVVFEEVSPYGTLMAVVEDDGSAVYLHLVGPEGSDFETRSVWVRNRRPAPMGLEPDWQSRGSGPPLPFDACTHPVGLPALRVERLNAVWFPEGDAVALREGDDVLAVLPPWAGRDGCPGFARDCRTVTPLAWPLRQPGRDSPILARLDEAMRYWDSWQRGEPWPELQRGLVEAYGRAFGPHTRYYTIDASKWPPRFLTEHVADGRTVCLTGGMSLRPQPQVDRYYENPAAVRHVELALSVPGSVDSAVMNHLSQLCAMPWHMNAWLAPGHTVPARGLPGPFSWFLVRDDTTPTSLPDLLSRGEPVNLLWLLPITESERDYAVAEGSEALLERLDAAGIGRAHPSVDRASVA